VNPDDVDPESARYPGADLTPAEFELFAAGWLSEATPYADDFRVSVHEKIASPDGSYDFDATVRFSVAGMEFLVLVECKKRSDAIKRELVQVLDAKLQSTGAHKGMMIAAGPYQRGAVEYARAHRIELVTVTEGRFTFETKDLHARPAPTRQEAAERFAVPPFVGYPITDEPHEDDGFGADRPVVVSMLGIPARRQSRGDPGPL